jgi:hypothetical protein
MQFQLYSCTVGVNCERGLAPAFCRNIGLLVSRISSSNFLVVFSKSLPCRVHNKCPPNSVSIELQVACSTRGCNGRLHVCIFCLQSSHLRGLVSMLRVVCPLCFTSVKATNGRGMPCQEAPMPQTTICLYRVTGAHGMLCQSSDETISQFH